MAKPPHNKAHSATVNRLALRYGVRAEVGETNQFFETKAESQDGSAFDVVTDTITITVQTTATVQDAIERLEDHPGPVYIAMTNREGVSEAVALTDGMAIGIMDPRGEIVKPYCLDASSG